MSGQAGLYSLLCLQFLNDIELIESRIFIFEKEFVHFNIVMIGLCAELEIENTIYKRV